MLHTRMTKRYLFKAAGTAALGVAGAGMVARRPVADAQTSDLLTVAKSRGLSPDEARAALATYVPPGKYDEALMFASGGQSGQVLVFGIPSMRLLRVIAVFSPESWQGYGYSDESRSVLRDTSPESVADIPGLTWGDTHHPAISQMNGDYDGEWLFINDKANARMAVISLKDFETKQIVQNPTAAIDHGATVSPNTDYVLESTQYAVPFPRTKYVPLDQEHYNNEYRGVATFWKFDRTRGRIDQAHSFQIELPPYWQDLASFGKGPSEGWVFINSFNTERAIGGTLEHKPPIEIGASANDMDYLHVINWKKAEALVAAGKTTVVNGIKVISLKDAAENGVLYFVPEPKSPHGVDVAPRGDYIVIGGKLDPNATVYSWAKVRQLINAGKSVGKDAYGVPILSFKDAVAAQVKLGLGPLHTNFDDKGNAYTSLFIESAVAKWTLGAPYHSADEAWKVVDKLPVQYNIGHLAAYQGDTAKPMGKYLVAINKWSVDQYKGIGPLRPQNLQLIDISGPKMRMLYAAPVGNAEPHFAEIIPLGKLRAWDVYPPGTNELTMRPDPNAVQPGKERIARHGKTVEVWMTAMRSHYTPDHIVANKGDKVVIHITNIEQALDATHGFAVHAYNINLSLEPGKVETITFTADRPGVFPYYCTEFCSALHLEMAGYLEVKP
ncbi:MAG TPA: Sec-dependent nitrous-oxide reductase [bacterium]|nr:Sec-dependent nitrous-oxide reductase [bacterium]